MAESSSGSSGRRALLREKRALRMLVALFLAILALCSVARSRWLFDWDHGISVAVQQYRSPGLDLLMEGMSALGNTETLVALGVIAGITYYRQGRRKAAVLLAAAVAGLPLNVAIKTLVGRPRPGGDIQVILPALGLSFPSGHSMGSTMIYGALAFLVRVHDQDARRRRLIVLLLSVLPVCVGASRVYLGAHWFSDVIGGWAVGLFFLLLFTEIYQLFSREEVERPDQAPNPV